MIGDQRVYDGAELQHFLSAGIVALSDLQLRLYMIFISHEPQQSLIRHSAELLG